MSVDKEALRTNMDRVIAADAQHLWQQGDWVAPVDENGEQVGAVLDGEYCRTAGCFAGHYAFSQGYTQVDWYSATITNPETGDVLDTDRDDLTRVDNVAGFTMHGLGLDPSQAMRLFNADNSLHQLKFLVDEICGTLDGS